MEIYIENDKKTEVDEVLEFISQLNDEEKKDFKSFMDGVKFAKKDDNDSVA